ncbi:hypothetical protein STEG23_036340, partial [Scotinomys teguina]
GQIDPSLRGRKGKTPYPTPRNSHPSVEHHKTNEQNLPLSLEPSISASLADQQAPPGSTCLCHHSAGIA